MQASKNAAPINLNRPHDFRRKNAVFLLDLFRSSQAKSHALRVKSAQALVITLPSRPIGLGGRLRCDELGHDWFKVAGALIIVKSGQGRGVWKVITRTYPGNGSVKATFRQATLLCVAEGFLNCEFPTRDDTAVVPPGDLMEGEKAELTFNVERLTFNAQVTRAHLSTAKTVKLGLLKN